MSTRTKTALTRLYWILVSQFGLDPLKAFRSLKGLPKYISDLYRFRSGYSGRIELSPCLHNWYAEGGAAASEYFWQDLLVARQIFEAQPTRHVDIGSRVDGFVAHVASFREIEVLDILPNRTPIPGVVFRQADLTKPLEEMNDYCDSVSCLHALEHFGLGRYGDPIDPAGFERGISNIARLLRAGGVLYLSVPLGVDRVEFNANRVFDPQVILRAGLKDSLQATSLTVIRHGGHIEPVPLDDWALSKLGSERYALGLFTFVKGSRTPATDA